MSIKWLTIIVCLLWLLMTLAVIALAGAAAPAEAGQIIPVETTFGGVTFEGWLEMHVAVPDDATELVGWGGYWRAMDPASTPYIALVWNHDGGVHHVLDHRVADTAGGASIGIPPVFLPAGHGHRVKSGDRVWLLINCGGGTPCRAGAIFYFLVP